MNRNSTIIWLILLILFLLPTQAGKILIDLAGGIMIIFFLIGLTILGIGWVSWKNLKENINTCEQCGSTYFTNLNQCPICGSQKKNDSQDINLPASSATIDVEVKDSD